METTNIEIYAHDNEVDMTHKINTMELDNWINHLIYIKKELNNLVNIGDLDMNDRLVDSNILQRLQKKGLENEALLEALQRYAGSRTNIAECDDVQCDMVFIKEHESYRRSYLYHLNKYRKLKDEFFNEVQGKCSLLNGIS